MAASPEPMVLEGLGAHIFGLTHYRSTGFQQIVKAFLEHWGQRGDWVKSSFSGGKLIWDPRGIVWLVSRLCRGGEW